MKAISTGFTILIIVFGFSIRMYRIGQMIHEDSGRSPREGRSSGDWVMEGTADQSATQERREKKKQKKAIQKNPFLD